MSERIDAPGYSIRAATPVDCAAILDVHRRSSMAARDSSPDDPVGDWLSQRRPEHYRANMETQEFIVAAHGDVILGFASLDISKHTVVNVFVTPEHMRQGVGTAMLTELERMAVSAGLEEVELQAAGGAIEFYRKLGYRGRGDADDPSWLRMEKPLARAARNRQKKAP